VVRRYFGPVAGSGLPAALEDWLGRGCTTRFSVTHGDARLLVDPLGERPAALLLREQRHPTAESRRPLGLPRREAEVLVLVADGRSNEEIAGLLTVSTRTVKKHLESIYGKLGVHTRTAAAAAALRVA
jgi:ATP/maltotriose-dependent transcriptional regulator MalT